MFAGFGGDIPPPKPAPRKLPEDFAGSSPVTRGILASTLVASAVLHARDPDGTLNVTLDVWRVLTEGEIWRLLSCHTVCTSMGPLLASSLSLYRLRALEPLLGSKKFGAFAAVASALALPFEATAGVYFGTVRLTPGPIPLVFALVVVYYAIVPPSKPRYFGVLGLDFPDKAFTFVVAGMLASCEGWDSIVPAVCGALVGGLYLMDTMSIQALRFPNVVHRCFSRLSRPFMSGRRGSPFPGGAAPPAARAARRPPRPAQALLGPARGRGGGGGGLFSFFTPVRQGSTRLRNASSSPPPPLPPQPPSEEAVASLMGMGFDRAAVVQALQQTGNDSYTAVNILVSRGGGRGSAPGSNDAWGDGSGATTSASPGRGSAYSSEAPHDHAS